MLHAALQVEAAPRVLTGISLALLHLRHGTAGDPATGGSVGADDGGPGQG